MQIWRVFSEIQKWLDDPPAGMYAQSRLGPPALKPPHHFFALSRHLYGLVTQCRTGHAFIGDYYRRFVPTEDSECPCGFAVVQTVGFGV